RISIVAGRKHSEHASYSFSFISVRRCATSRKFCNAGKHARPPRRSETATGKPSICGLFPRRLAPAPALAQLADARRRCRDLRARRNPPMRSRRKSCSINGESARQQADARDPWLARCPIVPPAPKPECSEGRALPPIVNDSAEGKPDISDYVVSKHPLYKSG